jgi:SAM-dependent methyltransferase
MDLIPTDVLPLVRHATEGRTTLTPIWHRSPGVHVEDGGYVAGGSADGEPAWLSMRPIAGGDPEAEQLVRLTPRTCWWLKCRADFGDNPVRLRITEYDDRGGRSEEWVRVQKGTCAIPIYTDADHRGIALDFVGDPPARFRIAELRVVEATRAPERFVCLVCDEEATRSEPIPVDEVCPPGRKLWVCPACRRLSPREQERMLLLRSLAGDEVHCPACGGDFQTFLPWGGRHGRARANARCPDCLSLERHRLLWLYFERHPELLRGTRRLLHVAPEKCSKTRFEEMDWIEYLPCDLHMEGYHYGDEVVDVDITGTPFPDESFDGVICSHVLEHVSDDRQALAEIHRILEPGGWAVIVVPVMKSLNVSWEDPSIVTPEDRAAAFGQWDHVRAYGRDYKDRILEAGFVQDPRELPELASNAARFRYGVNESEFMIWRKPSGAEHLGTTATPGSRRLAARR